VGSRGFYRKRRPADIAAAATRDIRLERGVGRHPHPAEHGE